VTRPAFAALLVLLAVRAVHAAEESIEYGPFGRVAVYRDSPHPRHVALLVSGDEGWNGFVIDAARALASLDTLVLGVDLPRYARALAVSWDEVYAAADLEVLSQFAQRRLGMPMYAQPVLVGYEAGGTLAYAALAQANPNTFRGAVSLSFCPELRLSKPLGRGRGLETRRLPGDGLYRILPAHRLFGGWIVLQGDRHRSCDGVDVAGYVKGVPHGKIVLLSGDPRAGQWTTALREAFLGLARRASVEDRIARGVDVSDLPLVEVPARGPATDILAVILTGDGGWASIDRDIGNGLAARGIAVVGLNSLRYFWTRRTPAGAAADLERILRHYLTAWQRQRALLIGYSRGADVLPFMASRLPPAMLRRVALIVLMGPELAVDFEFHLADWIGGATSNELPVLPEAEKLRGARVLCVYGEQEADGLCQRLDPGLAVRLALPGGHHFGGDYDTIVGRILSEAGAPVHAE
jgi:type IV secretory pathway VirJ component